MTSPKAALEYILTCFRDRNDSTHDRQKAIADAEAAIPIAELHEQIVKVIQESPSVFIKRFYGEGIVNSSHKELALLLTQLEAAKKGDRLGD